MPFPGPSKLFVRLQLGSLLSLFQLLESWLLPLYHEREATVKLKSMVLPMVVVMYFVFCTTGCQC